MSVRPILIMAGGTGGHVFPALAVADELTARGARVVWLGTRQGLEARLVPAAGYPVEWLRVSGLRGKGLMKRISAPFMLAFAMLQALVVLIRLRPLVVLGMGGFVTGPGGVMAWLLRRPLIIHEQNSVAGMTNRWLAPLARKVMEAFPASLPGAVHVGNPVRKGIAALPEPGLRLAEHKGRFRLLVLGGSLGAQALNEVIPQALAAIDTAQRPDVWHQTGGKNLDAGRRAYVDVGVEARVEAFVEDMAAAYGWADLVICRAGALTVAELAAVGVASVLVPYPHAVDDHQTGNARFLADQGAAIIVQQHDLNPGGLTVLLKELMADRDRVVQMAGKARALARTDAAQQVAAACLDISGQTWEAAA